MNHLGAFFHDRRMSQALGELAHMVGYRNIAKGANKICRLERDGVFRDDLLAVLADALDIDLPTVESLIEQDRQEHFRKWEAWANQPVPMQLVVRYMAAAYGKVKMPEDITTQKQAEAFACEYARQQRLLVCLVVSRRQSVWINKEGRVYARTEATPDKPNMPWMQLRSDKRRFLFQVEEKP